MGLVTIASLAHQGAHIIALVPDVDAPDVVQLLLLLRESTKNESIYAEACDMGDLRSITAFAQRWNEGALKSAGAPGASTGVPQTAAPSAPHEQRHTGADGAEVPLFPQSTQEVHRLDTILFLPSDEGTYKVGEFAAPTVNTFAQGPAAAERTYVYEVLGRFHLVNTILPSLLLMPPSRDIRVVSVVSPWYAAGLAAFDAVSEPVDGKPHRVWQPWSRVGSAALRWIVLASELQRRVDLLAAADTRPRTKLPGLDPDEVITAPTGALKASQRSHISSIMVCPGFERSSQMAAFFGTVHPFRAHRVHSVVLWLLWLALYPAFWLFGKSAGNGADAAVWGISARLSSGWHAAAKAPDQDILAPESSAGEASQWPGIEPARLYREGRIVVPPMPQRMAHWTDASPLWNATEAQVEAILGGMHRGGEQITP